MAGAVALTMAAVAAGCGSSPTTTTTGNSVAKVVTGGNINVGLPPATNLTWYFPLLNASNNTEYNGQLVNELYVPLFYVNSKLGIDYNYGAATNITYNKLGTVYHVSLNKHLTWSNGTPVTSADVLFAWQLLQALSAKNVAQPWPWAAAGTGDIPQGIKSVVANGKYAFTVTLKKPANQDWFIYNGLANFAPLPAAQWNKYPNSPAQEAKYLGAQATNPSIDSVVDGPYTLGKVASSQYWVLKPNKHYTGPGPKAKESITLTYEASNAASFAALKSGTLQQAGVDFSDYGAIKSLKLDTTFTGFNFGEYFVGLNLNSKAEGGLGPVFNQLYVRQAIQEGIDQNAINKSVYHGLAPAQYGPIPSTPATKFLDPALKKPLYPYNLTKAKGLLTSHGWKEVKGVMTKNGQSLSFPLIYTSGSEATTQMMELVQADLAKIGVKVQLEPQPFATLVGTITTAADEGKWDAVSGIGITYGGSYPTGQEEYLPGGGLNLSSYSNAKETALINATLKPAANETDILNTFYKYEYYTSQQLPVIWVPNAGNIFAVENNLKGVTPASINATTGYPLFQYWYLVK